jgi:hypothetical protein
MKRAALALLLLLPLWVVGCGGQTSEETSTEIEGPAFVTFYTDN